MGLGFGLGLGMGIRIGMGLGFGLRPDLLLSRNMFLAIIFCDMLRSVGHFLKYVWCLGECLDVFGVLGCSRVPKPK